SAEPGQERAAFAVVRRADDHAERAVDADGRLGRFRARLRRVRGGAPRRAVLQPDAERDGGRRERALRAAAGVLCEGARGDGPAGPDAEPVFRDVLRIVLTRPRADEKIVKSRSGCVQTPAAAARSGCVSATSRPTAQHGPGGRSARRARRKAQRMKPRLSSLTMIRCAARSGVSSVVSIRISGFSGTSYGSLMPVKPLMMPARAFAYSPLRSRCSQTSSGVATWISRNPPTGSIFSRTSLRGAA